ncbi:armadillo repeat-containing protein 6-like [Scleropages formosus]|uniref:Armadillo repeat-containing protein 6-like n=1 Tax=Scleropages formosus TaxID=113540 RepID=A0A0N8JY70_SCLFO|nr:armadillo repeat-containing protein 6-like [Scleropages formosus]
MQRCDSPVLSQSLISPNIAALGLRSSSSRSVRAFLRCGLLPPRLSTASSDSPGRTYRLLEMAPGELAVLRVVVEHGAQLKVSPGLHPLRRLELKDGLQAMHAKANLGRTRGAEVLGEAQQGQVPRLRGLAARRHFDDDDNNKHHCLPLCNSRESLPAQREHRGRTQTQSSLGNEVQKRAQSTLMELINMGGEVAVRRRAQTDIIIIIIIIIIMAKRRIAQETFDSVVKENMDDAESDEAKQDQTHDVLKALESLQLGAAASCAEGLCADLKHLSEQCKLGFAQRHLAAQKGAYPAILGRCERARGEPGPLLAALSALSALTDGQPDLLDAEGRDFLSGVLREGGADPAVTCMAVRAVRHCCVKHEQNRQDLVKAGVLALLTGAIARHARHAELVKECCAALRVMTFDDDVRVPFGHAHEHAKMIVLEHNGLKVIIEAAKAHPENASVLSELCGTLSRLAVRNEFCQDIVDLGGLKFMLALLADSLDHQDLVRQVLSALRAIAGNDDVKDAVINAGGAQLIVLAMNRHVGNPQVSVQVGVLREHDMLPVYCTTAFLCLHLLKFGCSTFHNMGHADVSALFAIWLSALTTPLTPSRTQKQCCMLLRNLVCRTQSFSQPILEMGAEALITRALATHRDCDDVARAALRDLGCKVELRELWTGKKGSLTN